MKYKGLAVRLFIFFIFIFIQTSFMSAKVYASASDKSEEQDGDSLIKMLNPDSETVQKKGLISEKEPGNLLVIYPDLTSENVKKSMGAIAQVYTSLGYQVDYCSEQYAADVVDSYDSIVWLLPDPAEKLSQKMENYRGHVLLLGKTLDILPDLSKAKIEKLSQGEVSAAATYTYTGENTFQSAVSLSDAEFIQKPGYQSGKIVIDGLVEPLVMGDGDVRYIALQDYQSDFAKAVLMQESVLWLWPYRDAPHEYSEYVVIDNIYPFTDPDRLLKIVNYMTDRNMNYVLAVMPIYQHANYPAMQQLCQVLKYAQAGNGAIILNAPIIQNDVKAEELQDKLTQGTLSYWDNGVYPLGLSVPSKWIYNQDLHDTLGRYRTLFIHDTDAFETRDISDLSTRKFLSLGSQLVTKAIGLDHSGVGYVDYCATAVYLDISMKDKDLYNAIDAARNSRIPLQSLKDMNHVVYMNKSNVMKWDGRVIQINGKRIDLKFKSEKYPENYNYQRSVYYRATANLAKQNRVLIVFSLLVLTLFILLAVLARRQMHKRFLYHDDK